MSATTSMLATAARPAARAPSDTPRGLVSSFLGAPTASKTDGALGACRASQPRACARR
jgi:hypothetical protein